MTKTPPGSFGDRGRQSLLGPTYLTVPSHVATVPLIVDTSTVSLSPGVTAYATVHESFLPGRTLTYGLLPTSPSTIVDTERSPDVVDREISLASNVSLDELSSVILNFRYTDPFGASSSSAAVSLGVYGCRAERVILRPVGEVNVSPNASGAPASPSDPDAPSSVAADDAASEVVDSSPSIAGDGDAETLVVTVFVTVEDDEPPHAPRASSGTTTRGRVLFMRR